MHRRLIIWIMVRKGLNVGGWGCRAGWVLVIGGAEDGRRRHIGAIGGATPRRQTSSI